MTARGVAALRVSISEQLSEHKHLTYLIASCDGLPTPFQTVCRRESIMDGVTQDIIGVILYQSPYAVYWQ